MRCGIVVLTHRNDPHSEQKEIISPEWKRYKGEQPGTKDTKDLDYKTDLWYMSQTYNRGDLWESKSLIVLHSPSSRRQNRESQENHGRVFWSKNLRTRAT
jgi:hypothetical protein